MASIEELNKIIRESENVRECLVDVDVYLNCIKVNSLKGDLYKKWLSEVRCVVSSLNQDKLTKRILDITSSFGGWNDEENFDTLVNDLLAIKKNYKSYKPKKVNTLFIIIGIIELLFFSFLVLVSQHVSKVALIVLCIIGFLLLLLLILFILVANGKLSENSFTKIICKMLDVTDNLQNINR